MLNAKYENKLIFKNYKLLKSPYPLFMHFKIKILLLGVNMKPGF